MSEYITDVAKWKNYSFLSKVWNTYIEFDKTLVGDTNSHSYEGVCEPIVRNYGEEKARNKDFCMKLVRNLGCYNLKTEYHNPNNDRCHILYNWIYNEKNKYKHSDEIITECFKDYIDVMSHNPDKHKCSYDSYNNVYEDPIKMTILDIFNNNMHDIINKLMGEYEKDEFSPHNFVCECVKIYRNIYNTYCAIRYPREGKGKSTCDMLKTIKIIYDSYLLRDAALKHKIPSLDADDNEYSNKCISKAKGLESVTASGKSEETSSQSREDLGRNRDSSLFPRDVIDENTGGFMSPTVSTTLGTVAGASSVLALLYKFTPGRKWIHSGIGRNRGRISSNLYEEGVSELLYNGPESEDFSSYNQRYDIGYSPI